LATSPRFTTSINDANGNEVFIITATASAVNEVTFANAATGTNPKWTASGGDTNVGLDWLTKGTGAFRFTGNSTQAAEIRFYEDTDFGTNYTAFKTGAAQSADLTYTWPSAYPTASTYVLTSSTAGALAWNDVYSITKPRINGGTSSATPTPDWDSQDVYYLTALATNAVFADPTGTPVNGQRIIMRITADGTNRNISFNTRYRGSTSLPLPTVVLANTTTYMEWMWNTLPSPAKMDLVGLTDGF
jgi:hypothetical protein